MSENKFISKLYKTWCSLGSPTTPKMQYVSNTKVKVGEQILDLTDPKNWAGGKLPDSENNTIYINEIEKE